MLVVAIDTSGDISSIALATEHGLVSELNTRHKMDLLKRLMPNLDRLVSDAGRTPGDLEGVVISLGPGSFTGIRIGMASAKSIAHVLQKPIVGIPTLDVLAHGASAACPRFMIPMIHARPSEAFWAAYRCQSGVPIRLTEDRASNIEEIVREAKKKESVIFCGDGAERNRSLLEAVFRPESILPEQFSFPRASVLVRLGIEKILRGESEDVFSIVPTYVRRPTPVVRLEEKCGWD
ncbi:MAG: tRNA (adenosine(37)-N6)-threonylcarbamoyltransferase complex dimerization subunit type 1 TsaB [Armatimonadetes bacterium]|nr:tRNA (adenosine(37)-N6)-threonylcarbamoyltransferase complex dimerization subunit type 1 TsaB [Armatimonadota bacterium]